MQSTKTISFRVPIVVGDGDAAKTYEAVTLREPTAGEYEAAEKVSGTYGMAAALIATVSGVPVDVVDQMFESQIDEGEDFLGSFGMNLMNPTSPSDDQFQLVLVAPVKLTDDNTALNQATLSLSEPTNQQRRKAAQIGGPIAQAIELISINAKVPKASVRAMCSRDFLAATGYFNGFQLRRRAGSGG